jgi:hypothetical protein
MSWIAGLVSLADVVLKHFTGGGMSSLLLFFSYVILFR